MATVTLNAFLPEWCGLKAHELRDADPKRLAAALMFSTLAKMSSDCIKVGTAEVTVHLAEPEAYVAEAVQQLREQEAARLAAQQEADARVRSVIAEGVAQAAVLHPDAVPPVNVAGPLSAAPQPAPGLAFDARGVLAPVAAPTPRADEPATLKLGVICERLGFTVTSAFVADVLHVKPAKVEGNRPGLYTESQFRTICRQLQSHVSAMAELYAGETA